MKYLKLLAITFMALMMASLTSMAHESVSSKGSTSYSGASPSIAYSVKRTGSMTNGHCAGHAKSALRKSGFGNRRNGNSFAVGSRGGYKGTVLCAISSTQAIVIVSGPSFSQSRAYANKLAANFGTH